MPNISYTFWMGILISILNPVPNISYTLLLGVLISIPNSVPESSAQYFMHILSGHPELSAWFQCPIFHIHSEWVFISSYWIQCQNLVSDILSGHLYLHTESSARIQCPILHIFLVGIPISIPNPVPNNTFLVAILISILNPVPNSSAQYVMHILSGHSYLHTEFSAWIQCPIFHVHS